MAGLPPSGAPRGAARDDSASTGRHVDNDRADHDRGELERELRELSFLHEFAQLATTARNWDELMRTVVDRTTVALDVEVCSVYLMERDDERLRLAATNGLDRDQIGKVTMALGEGLTGLAALERRPVASPDVRLDKRFKWVPGFDQSQFTSMLSVPLPWNDQIIGVLNVQTIQTRRFGEDEIEFLVTIAALLGGIVEKGRLQVEAEAQLETLVALDAARAELLAVVTHELRTPLAVVRAYIDLLSDAAAPVDEDGASAMPADPATVAEWREQATAQVTRLDRLVDSILASIRGEGLAAALDRDPFEIRAALHETIDEMQPLLRGNPLRLEVDGERLVGIGDVARFRQVVEHLLENEVKYAPPGGHVSIGAWREDGEVRVYVTDDGPGVPADEWASVFEAYVRTSNRPRGSGIGLYAARRLMNAMGGRIWLEGNGFGGSRFVVAVPEMRQTASVPEGIMFEAADGGESEAQA